MVLVSAPSVLTTSTTAVTANSATSTSILPNNVDAMTDNCKNHAVDRTTASLERLLRRADIKAATHFAITYPHSPSLVTPTSTGLLPLHYASLLGDPSLISALLKSSLTTVDIKSLQITASHGHANALKELISKVRASVIQNAGEAVFEAAYRGAIECVRILVLAGAPTDFRAPDGSMPLHLAAMSGSIAMVDCLLEAGASPFVVSGNGSMPVALAQRVGDLGVVGRLKGAMVEIEDARKRPQARQNMKRDACDMSDKTKESNEIQRTPGISPTLSEMGCEDVDSVPESTPKYGVYIEDSPRCVGIKRYCV